MYTETQKIFKKGSTTYYNSSLFFRGQIKKDVFSLYAYVRSIDDCVDIVPQKMKLFESLWKMTYRGFKEGKKTHPIVTQFVEVAKRKKFEWEWITAFWKSMRADTMKQEYTTHAELGEYMYGSAEVVGLMMAKILDLPEESYPYARKLGKAMQFVNFVRDIAEDRQLGRWYIPLVDRKRFLEESSEKEGWSKLIRYEIEVYQKMQKEAEKGYSFIPKRYRIPIKTAADMYKWTAQKIYNNPELIWHKKIKPSAMHVLMTLTKNSFTL